VVDEERTGGADVRRRDVVALVAGVFLTAVGVAGVVLGVVGDSVSTTTGSVVWLLIGVLVLVFGSRARRRAAGSSPG
jgi:membrane protein implicated in regulation of membrane protease activity